MNSTRHIDQDELALFAMQFLSQEEAASILQHLDHCSECRQALAAIQGDLAIYACTVNMHSPSTQARDRLLNQVGREKRENKVRSVSGSGASTATLSQPGHETGYPSTPGSEAPGTSEAVPIFAAGRSSNEEDLHPSPAAAKILPWIGWAIAAGLAVTAGDLYHERAVLQGTVASEHAQLGRLNADAAAARRVLDTLTDPSAMRVTLTLAKQAPVPQGKATYVPSKGSLVFIANNMEPLAPYKTYELWIIPANGRDPIPAGTFHPDDHGNASIISPDLPKDVAAKAFGITVEDEGGSRTPTMPIIMAGT